MNKSKGFTIIELIVVIAIIAVLAAIVLVNVTQYIAKSKDAAIKGNMNSMRAAAAVFYDTTTPTFADVCINATSGFSLAWAATTSISASEACNDIASSWCACAKLVAPSTATFFCVDEKGNAKETTTDCTAAAYCGSTTAPVCP